VLRTYRSGLIYQNAIWQFSNFLVLLLFILDLLLFMFLNGFFEFNFEWYINAVSSTDFQSVDS